MQCPDPVVLETHLPLPLVARGKVRDVYAIDERRLLFVATDRISAFDCVLGTGIPCKGRVLTQISQFWFEFLNETVPNHLTGEPVPQTASQLAGRAMVVKRAEMVPVECVARGYLAGSGWKEYRQSGTVCGIELPPGLEDGSRLPEPIFTPATKAQTGHDMNVSFEQIVHDVGRDLAVRLRDLTLRIYKKAAEYSLSRGIILADTKFEFGFVDGELVLGDEVLTPDSSRYWPADTYRPGSAQLSFDKQFVRDYLETLTWDKRPPAPALPEEVVRKTSQKYREAYTRLTGRDLLAGV